MNTLFMHRAPNLPPHALAEVLDRLIWCLADQGEGLLQVREAWLQSNERDRVEIALAMNETHPFEDFNDMKSAFSQIVTRWPDLELRCSELIEARWKSEARVLGES